MSQSVHMWTSSGLPERRVRQAPHMIIQIFSPVNSPVGLRQQGFKCFSSFTPKKVFFYIFKQSFVFTCINCLSDLNPDYQYQLFIKVSVKKCMKKIFNLFKKRFDNNKKCFVHMSFCAKDICLKNCFCLKSSISSHPR